MIDEKVIWWESWLMRKIYDVFWLWNQTDARTYVCMDNVSCIDWKQVWPVSNRKWMGKHTPPRKVTRTTSLSIKFPLTVQIYFWHSSLKVSVIVKLKISKSSSRKYCLKTFRSFKDIFHSILSRYIHLCSDPRASICGGGAEQDNKIGNWFGQRKLQSKQTKLHKEDLNNPLLYFTGLDGTMHSNRILFQFNTIQVWKD